MALTITHAAVATIPDDGTSEVGSDEWNAAHSISGSIAASEITSPGDLTRTNDTNVTLTLGGTPTGALLQATSITVGWSGTLAAARGGFGADISASSGVPLFATGAATFTSTTGTGDFVRAVSPTVQGMTLSGNIGMDFFSITDINELIAGDDFGFMRTHTHAGDTWSLQAYDTNAASYTTFITLTAGNPPTCSLSSVALGTPASGTLTNCTGLPVSTGISGLGTGVATFLATPSSANLASAVTDETGSGLLVFATSPSLTTPNIGTPSAGTLTNCTGLPVSTGISGLGTGVATFLATPSSANLASAVTDETGSGALVFGTSPTLSGATLSGITNLTGGQIAFPATQSASSDANTLDDYEEGTWTPAITFQTPGDLSIAYSSQAGEYIKIGREVVVILNVTTSTFTHSTASGQIQITGLPFTSVNSTVTSRGGCLWQGITKANYTDLVIAVGANVTLFAVTMMGSGQAPATITPTDMPTGGTVRFSGTLPYFSAS